MTGLRSASSAVGGQNVIEDTYKTTNQRNYQKYNIVHHDRPATCKPKVDTVVTGGVKKHFDSYQRNEYKQRQYKAPAVDMIPYP